MFMNSSITIYPEDDLTSGIYLGGEDYQLEVLKSQWMDMADADIIIGNLGDRNGVVVQGVRQKSKTLVLLVRVVGAGPDNREEHFDAVKRVIAATRGNLWWKFDFHSNDFADVRKRMVLGRCNGPFNTTIRGTDNKFFQLNVLVLSGNSNAITLVTPSEVTLTTSPQSINEPSSGVLAGTTNTRKMARFDIKNTSGGTITNDIVLENLAVDFDGNRVTTGNVTFTVDLGDEYTLRIDLERETVEWMHVTATSGNYVNMMTGVSLTSVFPVFVPGVQNEWRITGVSDGTVNYQYLPEFY
jgi:hypothetical protein